MTVQAETSDEVDDALAAMLARPKTKYALICRECRTVWPYQRDCKTVKAARDDRATCPECGDTLDLAFDHKEGRR